MANRVNDVVYDIVLAVREVLDKHNVSFDEYRAAVGFLQKYSSAPEFEVPLSADLWFNATIHDVEMKTRKGSVTNLEGPYFLDDIPTVTDEISSRDNKGEVLVLEGKVTDLDGNPITGAELFIWHSDSDGFYSGFASDFPTNHCRGKVVIGEDGRYSVKTRMPAPYTIPHDGPTGELLGLMGRHPWRPAHIHWKIRHPDFLEHTTQTYFEGGEWVDDDCVEGVRDALILPLIRRDGMQVMHKDFILDRK